VRGVLRRSLLLLMFLLCDDEGCHSTRGKATEQLRIAEMRVCWLQATSEPASLRRQLAA
jgi:hypothetical protein